MKVLKCSEGCSTVIAVTTLSRFKVEWPKCWYLVSDSEEEFPRYRPHAMEWAGDSWGLGEGVFRYKDIAGGGPPSV